MENHRIWVLVTDGGQAKVYEQETRTQHFNQVQALENSHELTREHGPDKPGRAFESAASARHTYEPKVDWHEHQKEVFVRELSQIFEKEHKEKKFPKAFLICPPKLIPFLREEVNAYINTLHSSQRPEIIEINKNLTHYSIVEIEDFIKSY